MLGVGNEIFHFGFEVPAASLVAVSGGSTPEQVTVRIHSNALFAQSCADGGQHCVLTLLQFVTGVGLINISFPRT